jgi:adenine-specific DNA-methyltransferase
MRPDLDLRTGDDTLKALDELDRIGRVVWPAKAGGTPQFKQYADEMEGVEIQSVWTDLAPVSSQASERLGYDTQKPEALLQRIIRASSNEGDLVLDCFCGSGTTMAVAEKLGRRWIGVDLGRYAIHVSRKRLMGIQRELHKEGKPYRPFDVYNLCRYERQWWQMERLRGADHEHRSAVLRFFRAAPVAESPSPRLHGTKGGAMVHVAPIDTIVKLAEAEKVARAAASAGAKQAIILAWEFEMDLRKRIEAVEAETGVRLVMKYIPREIMEPNRDEVQFFDAGALGAEAFVVDPKERSVDIRLKSFIPSLAEVPAKELEALRERAIASPFDFIDFWAVDFEHGAGKTHFDHHWHAYRTRKDRKLPIESSCKYAYQSPGLKRVCVKVIDVFGVDTSVAVEVTV